VSFPAALPVNDENRSPTSANVSLGRPVSGEIVVRMGVDPDGTELSTGGVKMSEPEGSVGSGEGRVMTRSG